MSDFSFKNQVNRKGHQRSMNIFVLPKERQLLILRQKKHLQPSEKALAKEFLFYFS